MRTWMGWTIGATVGATVAILAMSACSGADTASLRRDLDQLKARLRAQDGETPNPAQQKALVDARKGEFDRRITSEKVEDGKSKEQSRLEEALQIADRGLPDPQKSKVVLTCYKTLCKGTTTHLNRERYDAFVQAAFVGVLGHVEGKEATPDCPRMYPGWVSLMEAGPKAGGKFSSVLYVGRLPPPTGRRPSKGCQS